MGSFISWKKRKVDTVVRSLHGQGLAITEDTFISSFKQLYPEDWQLIQDKWQQEEVSALGKGHPMPQPDVYLREMFRNQVQKNTIQKTTMK